MNIKIVAVGKLKEKYWQEAFSEYEKRLSAYCDFMVEEVKEDRGDDIEKEGENILAKIGDREHVISLEIEGRTFGSEALAKHMEDLMTKGAGGGNITFVIGGSNGLSHRVKERADESLSFSKFTFPHQLMRVILAEQIYRAFKIMRNETYHK